MNDPTTRISLILRLKDRRDAEAWDQFAQIYQPVIMEVARKFNLTPSERLDVTQEVMVRLYQAIEKWTPDSKQASFRRWLYQVAKNTILNHIKRVIRRSSKERPLENESQHSMPQNLEQAYDVEFLRQSLVFLAERIRGEFSPVNWSAFWLTYAMQMKIEDAANELGISKSRIYVARSRIIRRLQQEAALFSEHDWIELRKHAGFESSVSASQIANLCDPERSQKSE